MNKVHPKLDNYPRKAPSENGLQILIENLPLGTTDDDIIGLVSPYGMMRHATFKLNMSRDGMSVHTYVKFWFKADASRAVQGV